MRRNSTGLIGLYERLLDRLRHRQPYQPSQPLRSVDLVGSANSGRPEQPQVFGQIAQTPSPPPEPAQGALSNPFQASISHSTPGPTKPWSFNQTILLNRSQRSATRVGHQHDGLVSLDLGAIGDGDHTGGCSDCDALHAI